MKTPKTVISTYDELENEPEGKRRTSLVSAASASIAHWKRILAYLKDSEIKRINWYLLYYHTTSDYCDLCVTADENCISCFLECKVAGSPWVIFQDAKNRKQAILAAENMIKAIQFEKRNLMKEKNR